ncbi:mCG1041445 [Mus musculus]|nr:mCG1041445 [Mus musculus]
MSRKIMRTCDFYKNTYLCEANPLHTTLCSWLSQTPSLHT